MEVALMLRAEHLIPLWLTIVLFVPLLAATVVLLVRRPRQRLAWLRRALMVLLLLVVAIRPATPLDTEQTHRMNANVFFVVDRTGSMNAEDYDGDTPRLDGVKDDMRAIAGMTEGSRYSIISFDSSATQQLPLTTDAGALDAWIDTLTVEPTAYSKGSNVDRPLSTLLSAVSEAKRDDPESSVLVYVLSDGENTDSQESETFSAAAQFVDGGGVLGYGTAQGGPMKTTGGPDAGQYITDSSGARGISKIDEKQLQTIAQQLGVPYLHRTEPGQDLSATMEGITLRSIPSTSSRRAPSFEDWYWIAAIPLALLFIWELGEMTYRLPRRIERTDFTRSGSEGGP
ncbi:VWA domain-containing protein [Brachybacterium huguangmaarense]|uniref:VWA domain-containing protein n=1 Tax=Brachybacterium huguangmaarense TaxID=1652028 RepID=A0ABY6FYQ2_9MICO|nr:vWA domain-containing protein [Brachybacterium huguangmaarense]UYG15992.1 VWA domain-containing protein [Brachybacterium huguangmaarense]